MYLRKTVSTWRNLNALWIHKGRKLSEKSQSLILVCEKITWKRVLVHRARCPWISSSFQRGPFAFSPEEASPAAKHWEFERKRKIRKVSWKPDEISGLEAREACVRSYEAGPISYKNNFFRPFNVLRQKHKYLGPAHVTLKSLMFTLIKVFQNCSVCKIFDKFRISKYLVDFKAFRGDLVDSWFWRRGWGICNRAAQTSKQTLQHFRMAIKFDRLSLNGSVKVPRNE